MWPFRNPKNKYQPIDAQLDNHRTIPKEKMDIPRKPTELLPASSVQSKGSNTEVIAHATGRHKACVL